MGRWGRHPPGITRLFGCGSRARRQPHLSRTSAQPAATLAGPSSRRAVNGLDSHGVLGTANARRAGRAHERHDNLPVPVNYLLDSLHQHRLAALSVSTVLLCKASEIRANPSGGVLAMVHCGALFAAM